MFVTGAVLVGVGSALPQATRATFPVSRRTPPPPTVPHAGPRRSGRHRRRHYGYYGAQQGLPPPPRQKIPVPAPVAASSAGTAGRTAIWAPPLVDPARSAAASRGERRHRATGTCLAGGARHRRRGLLTVLSAVGWGSGGAPAAVYGQDALAGQRRDRSAAVGAQAAATAEPLLPDTAMTSRSNRPLPGEHPWCCSRPSRPAGGLPDSGRRHQGVIGTAARLRCHQQLLRRTGPRPGHEDQQQRRPCRRSHSPSRKYNYPNTILD